MTRATRERSELFLDDAAHVLGQATVDVRDVSARFEHDNLGAGTNRELTANPE